MKARHYLPFVALSLALLAGCNSRKEAALTSGIDLANLDTTVAPGTDFYQYACGGWMKNHPLTDEYSQFGSFHQLAENNTKQLQELITEIAATEHAPGSIDQKIGDLYKIAMDSVKLNKDGAAPILPLLQKIAAVKSSADVMPMMAELVNEGIGSYFGFGVSADEKSSSMNIFQIGQGGIALGERDYYLATDSATQKIRDEYKKHIVKLFQLVGDDEATATKKMQAILEIETAIAKASKSRAELRDPEANYNKMTLDEFKKLTPDMDWDTYLNAIGAKGVNELVVGQVAPLQEVNKLLKTFPVEKHIAYLQGRVIRNAASYLSDDFRAEVFNFSGKVLSGAKEDRPRWKRTIGEIDDVLGEAVGQMYVQKYFPAAAKERMQHLVKNLQTALGERISNLEWMSDSTKQKALEKLNAFTVKVGYPDKWKDYTTLEIKNDSYWENMVRASRWELLDLLGDVASCSDKISMQVSDREGLEFILLKNGEKTGIKFRGVPNGHEFTSLLLAILNSDGKGKNFPDESICSHVKALNGPIHLTTYVSLTCTNCPDVVQALNAMTTLNPQIHHEMVDGAINQAEVDALKIQGVPSVFADGKLIHVGRGEFGELLSKLEAQYGINESLTEKTLKRYDVVVVGGGPAGASAAIYSARKGLSVAVVAERIGGQVKETVGIENLISVPETTGTQLADNLRLHMREYPIDLLEHRRIEKVTIEGNEKVLSTAGGEIFKAPAVIVATGASWRKLNVPGETEYIGRGVAFCPHCDGPFYKGKHVAVVGGGNSGIEAAIDLAGICSRVTVLEFMDELKADQVLQEKAKSLPNVEIFVSSQTTEVVGNGDKVTGIRTKDRKTGEERVIHLDGIFVQIGLAANSGVFKEVVETNRPGEIVIDTHCRTNVPGIYAAGDVSTVPFKQIIISMGEGAKAALSAFEDRVRGVLG